MSTDRPAPTHGTCFVVMGFGKKTDFETGHTFDLDLTYKYIIKPAVLSAGLECLRADDIIHSGPIETPMYEQLLNADVVIADLSTSNKNAYYELGVRHALRPYTTIAICEDGIKTFPFDISHNLIRQYHHMGEGIDFGEVERFRKILTDAIVEVTSQNPRSKDSPVYTFLTTLTPPALARALHDVAAAAAQASPGATGNSEPAADDQNTTRYSELMADVDAAQKAGDFEEAKILLKLIRKKMQSGVGERPGASTASTQREPAEDPYIIQRLALVTYKAKQDTPEKEIAALREACDLLYLLNPTTSNDTETLGLWGAVHKRLWEKAGDTVALDKAIRSYERGFYLRNDFYNGINFAFLLNVRAAHASGLADVAAVDSEAAAHRGDAIADFVMARRVRAEVVSICDQWLAAHPIPVETSPAARAEHLKNKYWVVATQAEAYLGIGKVADAERAYDEAYSFAPEGWMTDSTKDQRTKLEALLAVSPIEHLNMVAKAPAAT